MYARGGTGACPFSPHLSPPRNFPGRRPGAHCTPPPEWRHPWAPALRPGKIERLARTCIQREIPPHRPRPLWERVPEGRVRGCPNHRAPSSGATAPPSPTRGEGNLRHPALSSHPHLSPSPLILTLHPAPPPHFPGRRPGAYCTPPPEWRHPWAPALRPGKCGGGEGASRCNRRPSGPSGPIHPTSPSKQPARSRPRPANSPAFRIITASHHEILLQLRIAW